MILGGLRSWWSRRRYRDVVAAGGLAEALTAKLQALHPVAKAEALEGMPAEFPTYASVECGDRFSQVYIAQDERRFLPDFWSKGAFGVGVDGSRLTVTMDAGVTGADLPAGLRELEAGASWHYG